MDAQFLVLGSGAQVPLGIAAQVQPHAAPVARGEHRHVDAVPRSAALIEPAGVEVVAHVLPQPVVRKSVRVVLLRLAQQVVRYVVVEPIGHESEAEQAAVVGKVAVHVGRAFQRDHRLEGRRAQPRHQPLVHREIGDADGADPSVAPALPGRPFDAVVEVHRLLATPGINLAGRFARAPRVHADRDIAARDPPQWVHCLPVHVRVGLFFEVRGWHPHLVLAVGPDVQQHREPAVRLGTENVGFEPRAVPHRDLDVFLDDEIELRLGNLFHEAISKSQMKPQMNTDEHR